MREAVTDLANFVETWEVSKELAEVLDSLGPSRTRGAAIKILAWLGARSRLLSKKPLALDFRHEWCRDVRIVVERVDSLARQFQVSEDALSFAQGVEPATQIGIENLAGKLYNPPIHVLRRKH